MNSRVHPKYKTKYRVSNWAEYDRALVQRGDTTLWISPDAADSWTPGPSGKRGGQRKFSDQAIETALVLRLVFKLPLRQAEGFLRSVLSLMALDLEAPDHTTISRRSQQVDIGLRPAPPRRDERPPSSHRRQHRAIHHRRRGVGRCKTWGSRQARLEETSSRCRSIRRDHRRDLD